MFGLGMMEILMILAIALIVVGPQKLPELAKTLGKAMGEFKRSAQDLKRSMDVETTVKEIEIPKTDVNEVLNKNKDSETKNEKSGPYDTDGDQEQIGLKEDLTELDSDKNTEEESAGNESDDSKTDTSS